ncbi:MAG: UDP-N-acetylmuramoyl-tripeptide--D-alanyl-D-alanine ligase [Eubacterium sp.]|nr:UDP-N-acetylmuramoyl-tripeptide--D-alanyl-D-alanine ligase [Eubacterium sp.]
MNATSILMIITLAAEVAAGLLVARYNLHMFQLMGYKNMEHVGWLKKNWKKQALLIPNLILGLLALFLPSIPVYVILILMNLILCKYYGYLRKANTKKKLVYTMRVRRQVATNAVINLLVLVLVGIFLDLKFLPGTFAILISLQFCMLLVVNLINRPGELMITNHFIHDAQRMLKEVPGLTIIGVTGSFGKTSVKYYLQTLLQDHFNVLITPESYNTPMGVVKTIRESLKSTHEIFVCEMGARHVGDIKEICDIVHPDHGVITSIGPQHLETFFNMDNIVNTKYELADALPEDSMLFLNGDNDYVVGNANKYKNPIFYRSQSQGEGYKASDISLSQLGTEFVVTTPEGQSEKFQMRLVGEHNVINVVGAIAIAHKMGIDLKDLRVPVRRIQPVAHRLQMIERGNVTIIDDAYNSNPVGSKAAVETLAMFDGVRIMITPGMVELGKEEEEYNYKFGGYAAKCCDYVLLVGKKHTEPIKKGLLDGGFPQEKCHVYDVLEDALSFAYSIKDEGHKFILLENDLPDNY